MANLAFFTMCDSINNLQSGEMSIPMLVSPQITLRPKFIPGQFSFGIAFGFRDVELNKQNEFRFTIRQPNGGVVYDSGDMPLPLAPEDSALPVQYQGFSLCCDIRNIEIPCEGEYAIEFHLNGNAISQASLPIFPRNDQ